VWEVCAENQCSKSLNNTSHLRGSNSWLSNVHVSIIVDIHRTFLCKGEGNGNTTRWQINHQKFPPMNMVMSHFSEIHTVTWSHLVHTHHAKWYCIVFSCLRDEAKKKRERERETLYAVFIVQAYQTSQYVVPRGGIFLGKWRRAFVGSSNGKMNVQSVCALNTLYLSITLSLYTFRTHKYKNSGKN
jgi:hypothetical protein